MNNLTKQQLRIIADNNNTSITALLEERKALINKYAKLFKIVSLVFIFVLVLISLL